jgi:hypothetical protein
VEIQGVVVLLLLAALLEDTRPFRCPPAETTAPPNFFFSHWSSAQLEPFRFSDR